MEGTKPNIIKSDHISAGCWGVGEQYIFFSLFGGEISRSSIGRCTLSPSNDLKL